MANRRLANIKTRSETGLDYVVNSLNVQTPFGKKQLKEMKPFFPGQEALLKKEFEKTQKMLEFSRCSGAASGSFSKFSWR